MSFVNFFLTILDSHCQMNAPNEKAIFLLLVKLFRIWYIVNECGPNCQVAQVLVMGYRPHVVGLAVIIGWKLLMQLSRNLYEKSDALRCTFPMILRILIIQPLSPLESNICGFFYECVLSMRTIHLLPVVLPSKLKKLGYTAL